MCIRDSIYSEYMKAALHDGMYCMPLAFAFPEDDFARQVEDEVMIGESLLIAPVYEQNARGRYVYLPEMCIRDRSKKVGYELAMRFTKGEHAFVVADRQHIHNHVIFNSTALDGTRKFRDFFFSALTVQRLSDLICLQGSTCVNFHADWPLFFTQPMPIST